MFSEQVKLNLAIFTMSAFIEQRSCIKFSYRNGISCAESFRMLHKAFGDQSLLQRVEKIVVSDHGQNYQLMNETSR